MCVNVSALLAFLHINLTTSVCLCDADCLFLCYTTSHRRLYIRNGRSHVIAQVKLFLGIEVAVGLNVTHIATLCYF